MLCTQASTTPPFYALKWPFFSSACLTNSEALLRNFWSLLNLVESPHDSCLRVNRIVPCNVTTCSITQQPRSQKAFWFHPLKCNLLPALLLGKKLLFWGSEVEDKLPESFQDWRRKVVVLITFTFLSLFQITAVLAAETTSGLRGRKNEEQQGHKNGHGGVSYIPGMNFRKR